MTRRLRFSSKEVIKALERAGFTRARKSKGSHQALRGPAGQTVIVPLAETEILPNTLDGILRQAGMTRERFYELAGVEDKWRR